MDIHLLIVEDNPGDLQLIKEVLSEVKDVNFIIDHCDTITVGIQKLYETKYTALLLDLNLFDSRGISTFEKVKTFAIEIPIVILTGLHDSTMAQHAVHEGAQDYIEKNNLTSDALYKSILYAIERHQHLRSQLEAVKTIKVHMQSIASNLEDLSKKIHEITHHDRDEL